MTPWVKTLVATWQSVQADHLIQYGDNSVKLAIPLGLAMLHTSDPILEITDQLGRLSHDNSEEIAAACLALGIVGAVQTMRVWHQLRQLDELLLQRTESFVFSPRLARFSALG